MSKLPLFVTSLIFLNLVSGADAQICPPRMEGKQSCLSGELMQCVKRFDPGSKLFKFEWDAVNAYGQAIEVSSPLYKQTPGYTPASCSNAPSSKR